MRVYQRTAMIPKCPCPHCGEPLTCATSFEDESPWEGDLTICVGCLKVLMFTKEMGLSEITREERRELDKETRDKIFKMKQAVAIAKATVRARRAGLLED